MFGHFPPLLLLCVNIGQRQEVTKHKYFSVSVVYLRIFFPADILLLLCTFVHNELFFLLLLLEKHACYIVFEKKTMNVFRIVFVARNGAVCCFAVQY